MYSRPAKILTQSSAMRFTFCRSPSEYIWLVKCLQHQVKQPKDIETVTMLLASAFTHSSPMVWIGFKNLEDAVTQASRNWQKVFQLV